MTDILMFLLMFLARGFALFAAGPALVNSYPLPSRGVQVVEARKRLKKVVRMVRYVAFFVPGSTFVLALVTIVQTHRLSAQTPSAMVVTTAVRQ
jgi:hypothetical protein